MSCVNIFHKLLNNVDILGHGYSLKVHQREKTTTVIGGLLTIIMIFMLGGLFIANSRDVFEHKNPNISLEKLRSQTYSNITLDNNSFPFAFGIALDNNNGYYNTRYFNYELTYKYGFTSKNLTEYNIKFDKCCKNNFPNIPKDRYDGLNMDTFFCI